MSLNILLLHSSVAACVRLKEGWKDGSLGEEFAKFANQLEAGQSKLLSQLFRPNFPLFCPKIPVPARPHSLRPHFTVFEQNQRGKNYQPLQFIFFIHRRNSSFWNALGLSLSKPSLWMASLKSHSLIHFILSFSTSGISFDPLKCFRLSCFSNNIFKIVNSFENTIFI